MYIAQFTSPVMIKRQVFEKLAPAPASSVVFGSILPAMMPQQTQDSLFPKLDAIFNGTQYLAKRDKDGQITAPFYVDMARGWDQLPVYLQKLARQFLNPSTPKILNNAIQSKQMGILEEASDIWHESLAVAALQAGFIDEPKLDEHLNEALFKPGTNVLRNLKDSMDAAIAAIPWETAEKFAKIVPLTKTQARDFLGICNLKYATLKREGKAENMLEHTRTQMMNEYFELVERIPKESYHLLYRLSDLTSPLCTREIQPHMQTIQETLIGILRETIGDKANGDIMFDFSRKKHTLRQALRMDKFTDKTMSYDARKAVLKPFEAIIEALMVKRCSTGFQVFG